MASLMIPEQVLENMFSVELPVGAVFRTKDTLFRVIEAKDSEDRCSSCAFRKQNCCEIGVTHWFTLNFSVHLPCHLLRCKDRQDGKEVFFRRVTDYDSVESKLLVSYGMDKTTTVENRLVEPEYKFGSFSSDLGDATISSSSYPRFSWLRYFTEGTL